MKASITIFCIIAILMVTSIGCQSDKTSHSRVSKEDVTINDFNWLVGTWKRETRKGMLFESWKIVNDSLLSGFSYGVSGSDTTLLETLSIEN